MNTVPKNLNNQDEKELENKREKYKQQQKERLDSMLPGSKDFLGNTISRVFARGDEYVIYEIESDSPFDSLKVRVDTQIEEDNEPIKRFQAIKDEFDKFKSTLYKTGADASYKFRAATAVTVALQGDIKSAKALFCNICDEAEQEYREKLTGRLFYLSGALTLVILLVLLSILAYLSRNAEFVLRNQTLVEYLHAVTFASIGGLISVSIRVRHLNIGEALRETQYAIYGAERIMFAALGGVVIFTLLKAGLILDSLVTSNKGPFPMLAFCFTAGFSETLIPNALANLETRSSRDIK